MKIRSRTITVGAARNASDRMICAFFAPEQSARLLPHPAASDALRTSAAGTGGPVASAAGSALPGEHRFHLGLERGGVERLDDVVADTGLLRGDDVFGLRFSRDHD